MYSNDETANFSQQDIMQNKGISVLSYLSILVLVPLLSNRGSAFVKFHANQGLILFIIAIANGVIGTVLSFIPIPGVGLIRWAITSILGLFTFILAIMGIVYSAQGRAIRLPIIGNIQIVN